MIDIGILRSNPDLVKANCKLRGADNVDVDALVKLDKEYLSILHQVEELRARRNTLSKECKDNPEARTAVKDLKLEIAESERNLAEIKADLDPMLSWIPNFLSDDVPKGHSDADNKELKSYGEKPDFDFDPLDHQALGERFDIIDTARGAKVAQSGYYFWKGKGAQLASALFFWAQQELIKRGFTLFFTPCAAKASTLFGTGYLPFFSDQTYQIEDEDLALIGTSEQTLVGYHANEILAAESLPKLHMAYSPCFRTEAGSYGKETRGIFRVHQFHKVEQIVFCSPDDSDRYHRICLDNEEFLLQQLELPYRVVNVCVGDLGAPGYKKYDVDAYFPGYGGYREVCSNTNLTDFQSRRLGIRYTRADGRKEYVHTISATAVTDRVVCAVLENYQRANDVIDIPSVLQPYTGFDKITL